MKRTRILLDDSQLQIPDNQTLFQAVCKDLSENIDADLFSIWFFPENDDCMECHCMYDVTKDSFTGGHRLIKKDYPNYFKNLIKDNFISAPDARTHYATKELNENYLKPTKTLSLLDYVLYKDLKAVGVVGCETLNNIRDWTERDRAYLLRMTTLISSRFIF